MPNYGDKMYSVEWRGIDPVRRETYLRTVTFVKETLLPGAKIKVYVLKDEKNREFCCSKEMYKEMYVETPKAAWERHLEELRESLPAAINAVKIAESELDWLNREIQKLIKNAEQQLY